MSHQKGSLAVIVIIIIVLVVALATGGYLFYKNFFAGVEQGSPPPGRPLTWQLNKGWENKKGAYWFKAPLPPSWSRSFGITPFIKMMARAWVNARGDWARVRPFFGFVAGSFASDTGHHSRVTRADNWRPRRDSNPHAGGWYHPALPESFGAKQMSKNKNAPPWEGAHRRHYYPTITNCASPSLGGQKSSS